MGFRYKALEDIKEQDLLDLIADKVSEEKDLDYKRDLPEDSPSKKREFLADVSSFANAAGGHLIFGLDERKGVPTAIKAIQSGNPDADILRLESMIRDGIRPRIINIEIKEIRIASGGHAIIVRIPRSWWNAPHMVTLDKWGKFFSRTSRGKHQLDVDELRIAFMLSETAGKRIREFREERASVIAKGQTPVRIEDGPKLVLHLVPMGAFGLAESIDIKEIMTRKRLLQPMRFGECIHSPNFDGFLAFDPEPSFAYTQFYRNGCIEAVRVLTPVKDEKNPRDLEGLEVEKLLLDSIPPYLELLRTLGVSLPILIMISLLGVEGYSIVSRTPRFSIRSEFGDLHRSIDRPNLLVPEVMIESYSPILEDVLKLSFHSIWNAAGWTGSPNMTRSVSKREKEGDVNNTLSS